MYFSSNIIQIWTNNLNNFYSFWRCRIKICSIFNNDARSQLCKSIHFLDFWIVNVLNKKKSSSKGLYWNLFKFEHKKFILFNCAGFEIFQVSIFHSEIFIFPSSPYPLKPKNSSFLKTFNLELLYIMLYVMLYYIMI